MVHASERAARLPKGHTILEHVLNERIVKIVARWSCVPLHCNSLANTQLCHTGLNYLFLSRRSLWTPLAHRNPESGVHNFLKR